jgi:hypothetical protein
VFTILPTVEDADTTCPKDTTASSWNKPGLPGAPASAGPSGPQGRGRVTRTPGALQVRQDPGTRPAPLRRWISSTRSLRRHGHHPDQPRQRRSRQHHRQAGIAAADAVRPALGTSRMARPANDPYGQPIDPGAFSMAQNDAPMVVKPFFSREFGRCGVCWETDKTGKGRSWWRAGSYQVTRFSRVRESGPGRPADRSKASTGCGSRFAGQAAPGTAGVSRRRAGGGRPGGRRTASGSG